MSNRLDKTAADYIAIAIGPALIMVMVGSLVFFLVELYYQGDYEDRLRWILSCFVFAAVLIGRISIESGTARATLFALPLAISVGLAISVYVKHTGPLASIGLYLDWAILGVIWWCANKLTWDCTFIDDQQVDTGEGLLQTIGLDDEAKGADATPPEVAERIAAVEALAKKRRLAGTTGDEDEQAPKRWWERWLEGDQRPHAPGVWVVYFSLAALPIFGIGQLFIPAADEERRQYVFQLLVRYVAAGLGLLLTTSFLGMRRYLRQRYVEMPPHVAKKWIGIGCGLGLGLLVLAMLLPRPNAEYGAASLTGTIGSPQRQASPHAPPGGSGGKDPQKQARSTTTKGKKPGKQGTGGATKSGDGSSLKTGEGRSSGKTSGGGEPSGKTSGASQPQGNGAAKTSTDLSPSKEAGSKQPPDSGAKSQPGSEGSKTTAGSDGSKTPDGSENGKTSASPDAKSASGKSPDGKSPSDAAKSGSSPDGEQAKTDENADGSDEREEEDSQQGEKDRSDSSSGSGSSSPSSSFRALESLSTALSWLPSLFKWVLHAAIIAVVAYLVWRHRKELWTALVGLWTDLRNLLAGLFGGKKKARPAAQPSLTAPSAPQGRPFADYPNPYATGLVNRLSADQLVAYTFEALEAWAREHGYPREADQTPLEFAVELASASAPLAEPVRLLALLYCQVAYAPGTLRPERTSELEHLWRLLSGGTRH